MNEPIRRLAAVMMLSVILPGTIAGLAERWMDRTPTEPTASATEQTQPTATEQTMQSSLIPVLMDDGVEEMALEEYICGVVAAEMPASFGEEALKAQAVAARTYALRRLTLADRHYQGAVCTDHTCCQAWISEEDYLKRLGSRKDLEKIHDAVMATAGLVLTYWGKLAETTYFSCSGGMTEAAVAVWGEDIPYLRSVASPGEEDAAEYEQTLVFAPEEFSAALGLESTDPPELWLGQAVLTQGGGVEAMEIGGVRYSGVSLRSLLGLNSTMFTVTYENERFTVTVRGHGHRVGMSQYGADAMAERGREFDEILAYYYPGTVIDKWEDVG